MRILHWFLDLLYPPRCTICQNLLRKQETGFCKKCLKSCEELEDPIRRGRFFKQCHALFPYSEDIAASVRRYKYRGMSQYADFYGQKIAMVLLRRSVKPDLITWAPLSRKRRSERGYDQAELLARAIAKNLGIPCVRTLKKKHIPPQTQQTSAEARQGNVRNAYSMTDTDVRGKRILIVDDVLTTGATLSECSSVLLIAGAASVECATIAATMHDK